MVRPQVIYLSRLLHQSGCERVSLVTRLTLRAVFDQILTDFPAGYQHMKRIIFLGVLMLNVGVFLEHPAPS